MVIFYTILRLPGGVALSGLMGFTTGQKTSDFVTATAGDIGDKIAVTPYPTGLFRPICNRDTNPYSLPLLYL